MTEIQPWRLTRPVRIRVGDDDSSGLLFFASLFRYVSDGEQDVFVELGMPSWEQIRAGSTAPVVHASADYAAPAACGTLLSQHITVTPGRRSSLHFEHVFLDDGGADVARARTVRCWVDLASMAPVPLPEPLLDRLAGPGTPRVEN